MGWEATGSCTDVQQNINKQPGSQNKFSVNQTTKLYLNSKKEAVFIYYILVWNRGISNMYYLYSSLISRGCWDTENIFLTNILLKIC